ncbi:unnamed protein product [Brachionus calyciflorus]|uniref:Uncharacterized protein n=1 Tax=Brachionus calyciflorus TaxID=104777 RepID=A0A813MT83_9BILA|nr:unnamed protein product [Brachionus calyciflorus]
MAAVFLDADVFLIVGLTLGILIIILQIIVIIMIAFLFRNRKRNKSERKLIKDNEKQNIKFDLEPKIIDSSDDNLKINSKNKEYQNGTTESLNNSVDLRQSYGFSTLVKLFNNDYNGVNYGVQSFLSGLNLSENNSKTGGFVVENKFTTFSSNV